MPDKIKIEKVEKLVVNLHDKEEYVKHIRNLNEATNHGLVLEKVYRVIKFNQKAWLKRYIDINTKLRKKVKQKMISKRFFQVDEKYSFWENHGNCSKT